MPAGPRHRIETSKQAKAAFKARGSSYISDVERRRIERGAELLERAARIKALEEKKKEWAKRREADQTGKREPPNLSSQRKLDRFGYASSQFHLGKFFTVGDKDTRSAQVEETNNDDNDSHDQAHDKHASPSKSQPKTIPEPPQTSHFDISAFLSNSSQLARELSLSPLSPKLSARRPSLPQPTPPQATKSRIKDKSISFSSEDGLFDDQTVLELDRAAEAELLLRQPVTPRKIGAMLPPARPLKPSPPVPQDLSTYGISAADLELVAGDEVQLSQFSA